jgi:hypothetical protein
MVSLPGVEEIERDWAWDAGGESRKCADPGRSVPGSCSMGREILSSH